MEPFITDQEIHPLAQQIIRQKTRRLIGRAGFTPSDQADIEQEMLFKLARCQVAYDPERARPSTFIKTVSERKAINLLRDQQSRGRSNVRLVNLDSAHGGGIPTNHPLPDLQLDLQEKLRLLSPDDQHLCHCLMHLTFSQAARALGVPRSTLQGMANRLGQRLIDVGMGDYATHSSVNSVTNRVSESIEIRS